MLIKVNTDSNIEGSDALTAQVSSQVESALSLISADITRVEVHLSDENAGKGGADDKRCEMEARLAGRQPITVTHKAATLEDAVEGAADALSRLIESTLGKQRHQEGLRD